jgi:hypothetical protein
MVDARLGMDSHRSRSPRIVALEGTCFGEPVIAAQEHAPQIGDVYMPSAVGGLAPSLHALPEGKFLTLHDWLP